MRCQITDTFFPIHEMPVPFYKDGNWYNNNTGYVALLRYNPDMILSIVSDKYQLVTNMDIMNAIKDTIRNTIYKIKPIECNMFDYKRVSYTLQMDNIFEFNNTKIQPRITITNSYDRTKQLSIKLGFFVQVCSNGMMMGTTKSLNKYKHLTTIDQLSHLNTIFDEVLIDIDTEILPKLQKLAERTFDITDTQKLFEMFPEKDQEHLKNELIKQKPKTMWGLLNVGTYVLTHKSNRDYEATHKIEESIYTKLTA